MPQTPNFIKDRDQQEPRWLKSAASRADPTAIVLGEDAQVGTTLTVEASNASADSSMFMVGRGVGSFQQQY